MRHNPDELLPQMFQLLTLCDITDDGYGTLNVAFAALEHVYGNVYVDMPVIFGEYPGLHMVFPSATAYILFPDTLPLLGRIKFAD